MTGDVSRPRLDAALDCVISIDDHGRVFNRSAKRTFG
jgi:hypothetical protein